MGLTAPAFATSQRGGGVDALCTYTGLHGVQRQRRLGAGRYRMTGLEVFNRWQNYRLALGPGRNAVLTDIEAGRITEAFCMDTSAVIVPNGRIGQHGRDAVVGGGTAVLVTTHLYRAPTDIQYGRAQAPYGWTRIVHAKSGAHQSA